MAATERDYVKSPEIPPTPVGGLFILSLHKGADRLLPEYHPRQWVDCSGAAYKTAARPSVLDISPLAPRGKGEGKTGISGAPLCRPDLNNPPTAVVGIQDTTLVRRPDLKNPPTAVGGIQNTTLVRRPHLNNPPTAVGGIAGAFTRSPIPRLLQRSAALLAGALIALTSTSACTSRGETARASSKGTPAQEAAVDNLTRRPISDIPQIKKVVDSAIEQTRQTFEYDSSYAKLDYPNGDVPLARGVCADVIVRAFRSAGLDLQKEIHEDMVRHFSAYPAKWGARKPDSNIDHRRVPNLMTLFERQSKSAPITRKPSDYVPGDVVAWELDNRLLHIGLVTDAVAWGTQTYLVVHNIGAGAKLEDVLMAWKIIGHYRMWK